MPTRHELGSALLDSLREVSALLERAHAAAVEQQAALVKNDAATLVRVCRSQEELLRRIAESDRRAAEAATELAQAAGLDPEAVDTSTIGEALRAVSPEGTDNSSEIAALVAAELSVISGLAEKVREANEVNQKLLSNGLDIIACCLRTLASDQGQSSYSSAAELHDSGPCVLSVDRKA